MAAVRRQRSSQLKRLVVAARRHWRQHRGGKHGGHQQRCRHAAVASGSRRAVRWQRNTSGHGCGSSRYCRAASARHCGGNKDTGGDINGGGKDNKEAHRQRGGGCQLVGNSGSLAIALCWRRWQRGGSVGIIKLAVAPQRRRAAWRQRLQLGQCMTLVAAAAR